MKKVPFYDPNRSYEDNYNLGPFGALAENKVFEPKSPPEYMFLGTALHSLFGIPAGPLLNNKFVRAAGKIGFPVLVYKTVRSSPYLSHEKPNIVPLDIRGDLTINRATYPVVMADGYRDPLSITNSFGVPSMSPKIWQSDMADAVKEEGVGRLVVGSFQGTTNGDKEEGYIADCVKTAEMVANTGVKVMELNLSCPNEGGNKLLCFDIERVEIIVRRIKDKVKNVPLILKIAYFESEEILEKFVDRLGGIVEGIAAINTIPAIIVDKDGKQALPGIGREKSGVCGAAIKWAGLEMVKRLVDLREKKKMEFVVVGVGGVMNYRDYKEYRSNGADLVLSATGAMWNPYLAQEIYKEENK